jgi:hypothetical protein
MDILHFAARVVVAPAHACLVLEEVSGVNDRPMTTTRAQRRYDHRLRNLVRRTGNVSIATDLGSLARQPVGGSARHRRS